jgi:hypothetical protein
MATGNLGGRARLAVAALLVIAMAARPLQAEQGGSIALRAEPASSGPTLARLQPGDVVRRIDCARDWCRVRRGALVGFVPLADLPALLVAPPAPPRSYVNARGATVAAPADSPDGRAPAGATARCRDGMFSFSHTRSGTCSHHGGVAQWLAPVAAAPR